MRLGRREASKSSVSALADGVIDELLYQHRSVGDLARLLRVNAVHVGIVVGEAEDAAWLYAD